MRSIVQHAYGQGVAEIFLAAAPFALIAFLITLFIKEKALRTSDLPEPGDASATPSADESNSQHWNTPEDHAPEVRLTHAQWVARQRAGRRSTGSTAIALGERSASARIDGVVKAAAGRVPVPHATVTVVDGTGRVAASAVTGADGRYAFGDLEAGPYALVVGYAPTTRVVVATHGGTTHSEVLLGEGDGAFAVDLGDPDGRHWVDR